MRIDSLRSTFHIQGNAVVVHHSAYAHVRDISPSISTQVEDALVGAVFLGSVVSFSKRSLK